MKPVIALLLIALLLSLGACGYSQEQLQEAWDKGYESGYGLGYIEGWNDAVTQKPATTPTTPSAKVFVGSVNSDIYHYPHCQWAQKISPQNEIWFSSSSDAKAHGYRACKVCRPP